MVMKIKFVLPLTDDSGLRTPTGDPFHPTLDIATYTVIVRSDDFVKLYIGSIFVAEGKQDFLVELIRTGYVAFV